MTATHHTAWITTDSSCLAGDHVDVVVLTDEVTSYNTDDDGAETPVWESTGPQVFHTLTTVRADAATYDGVDKQAENLLAAAGWTVTGDWEAVPTGYTATVERDDDQPEPADDADAPQVIPDDAWDVMTSSYGDRAVLHVTRDEDTNAVTGLAVWVDAHVPSGDVVLTREDVALFLNLPTAPTDEELAEARGSEGVDDFLAEEFLPDVQDTIDALCAEQD